MPYPPEPELLKQKDLRPQDLADPEEALWRCYLWMHLSRRTDDRLVELFRQGLIKGTAAGGQGNESLVVPIALLADKEIDVISFTHRGLGGKLIWSRTLGDHICHYLANSGSPTLAREGNVHYGDTARRSYPMISHLGSMPPNVLGGTDSQRRNGLPAVGITFFGDGASSTGDIHESMNLATLYHLPVLFVVENNEYAYSTPLSEQFATPGLVQRADAYGMKGRILDTADTAEALQTLHQTLGEIRESGEPQLIEARCLRLAGHAAYDTCDYLAPGKKEEWAGRDPLPRLRKRLLESRFADELPGAEETLNEYLEGTIEAALGEPPVQPGPELLRDVLATTRRDTSWKPGGEAETLTMAQALQRAHKKILAECPESIVLGQDIAGYGGPFKVTEKLVEAFGRKRVVNTPVAESGTVGLAIGLALNGHRPIVEFQFADFATDATTQILLNAGTYHFRAGAKVPLVLRFPCGGGLNFGTFHSQDLEALYLHTPGLKLLYPSTPQDAYNALLAAYEDDNPVLLFEHKKLYRNIREPVAFDPNYRSIWHPRLVREGDGATLLTYGEMVGVAVKAVDYVEQEYEIGLDLFDLRALAPLDLEAIRQSLRKTRRLAILHEGRRTCGFGAELVSRLTEELFFEMDAPPLRMAALDTPVPFASELEAAYRPGPDSVIETLLPWLEQR